MAFTRLSFAVYSHGEVYGAALAAPFFFDHEVIASIAAYLGSGRAAWDIFLDEDFRSRLSGIEQWQGDGIIANFDDPATA